MLLNPPFINNRLLKIWGVLFMVGLSLMFGFSANAQLSGRVIDAETKQGLPFVNLVSKSGKGAISDLDGYFNLKVPIYPDTLVVSFVGYQTKKVPVFSDNNFEIELDKNTVKLSEVAILPGVNPAERIIKKVFENRDKNNPEKNLTFSYTSYNKMRFDVDTSYLTSSVNDTELTEINSMHIFLSETVSKRVYGGGTKNKETVLATKVSGLSNPFFGVIASEIQSFSFYEDFIKINEKSYLSPISKNSEKSYLFILRDTTYIEQDTVFIIDFQPRKGKNFQSLKGTFYINTNAYALQNVLAESSSKVNRENEMQVSIHQQYEFVKGYWFPSQLNSNFYLVMDKKDSLAIVGELKSYLRDIVFNPSLSNKDFGLSNNDIVEDAGAKQEAFWEQQRERPLTEKEIYSYGIIDSIGEVAKLDERIKILEYLVNGGIPIGFVSLDLSKLLRISDYEGTRLGIGLKTNKKVSEYFALAGYWGYGFKDEKQKYGASLELRPKKDERWLIGLQHQFDLLEPGSVGEVNVRQNILYPNYRPFFMPEMDAVEKTEFYTEAKLAKWISARLEYRTEARKSNFGNFISNYSTTEYYKYNVLEAKTRIAPKETYTKLFNTLTAKASNWPVINVQYQYYHQAFSGWSFNDYVNVPSQNNQKSEVHRFNASIEQTIPIKRMGEIKYKISGGLSTESAQNTLYFNPPGNALNNLKDIGVTSWTSFETMRYNEFFTKDFLAFQYRHNFKSLLFSRPKFKPELVLLYQVITGAKPKRNVSSTSFTWLQKPFQETGLEINNLFKYNFMAFGIGGYYRLGAYQYQDLENNVSLKLNAILSF